MACQVPGLLTSTIAATVRPRSASTAGSAGFPIDLVLDVWIQLRDRHDPVAVAIRLTRKPLQQVVGEEAVPEIGRFQRDFVGAARRDDQAPSTLREPLEELIAQTARPGIRGHEGAAARRAAVRRVQEEDDTLGRNAGYELLHFLHREGRAPERFRLDVARDQILRLAV